ncbi:Stress responsive A/B Barrel Domain protein [Gemmata sp. SH-PL17]|uniref:Dabb family protein n=1 Tax=Gemmata sp. SH-PL17 TaxID=1630693 RepID=UPI0004B3B1FA|nr:Dabb family protein [Gemmata sp. SH-PL17]AMV23707.1 Stress responsive A/B Barrel Domain protein [Gemmata sp. SH-PL17]
MLRLLVAAALVACCVAPASAEDKKPPMIGHMVYFKLKDNTPENRKKLVAACEKYLAEHPGTVFFSAGEIGDEFKRDVNDRDWDVALHLVFVDKAAHDKYAVDKEHLKFIDENKANWAKVRVFDSELRSYKASKK